MIQPGRGALYAAIHGRDQLGDNWGFSAERNAENPAEELVVVGAGDDFGWPYCYFSVENKAKVLAPEYGGDGQTVGRCAKAKDPAIAFPAHWAATRARVLSGRRIRAEKYKNGLFIAFHGSLEPRSPAAGWLPRRVRALRERHGRPGTYETFAHEARRGPRTCTRAD